MNTEKQHSPLPWEAKSPSLLVLDPYDNIVADCETVTFESERMANAEFIALACNSHYTLVDALARLTDASTVLTNLKQSNFAIRADVWDEMYAANKAAQVALAELGNCAKRTPVATKSLRVG